MSLYGDYHIYQLMNYVVRKNIYTNKSEEDFMKSTRFISNVSNGKVAAVVVKYGEYKIYVVDINNLEKEPKCFTCESIIGSAENLQINSRWLAALVGVKLLVWDLNEPNNQIPRIVTEYEFRLFKLAEDIQDTLVVFEYSLTYVYNLNESNRVPINEVFVAVVDKYLFTSTRMSINVRLLSNLNNVYILADYNLKTTIESIAIDVGTVFILSSYGIWKWNLVQSDIPIQHELVTFFDKRHFRKIDIYGDYVIVYDYDLAQVYNKFTLELIYEKRLYADIQGTKDGMIVTRKWGGDKKIKLIPLFNTPSILPLLIADVLPSDVLYDVFKLL